MELVALLRVLWRHRIVVALGGVVAIGLALMLTRGPTIHSGVASMRVRLDTTTSELLVSNPPGAPTLGWRAQLLGDVMTTDTIRLQVARAMRTSADNVLITTPAQSVPAIPVSLPVAALEAAATAASSKPFQVDVLAASPLPIIRIDARAPTRRDAARLVTVTANLIRVTARAGAAAPGFPDLQPQDLAVRDTGPVRSRDIVNGPRRAMAAAVAFVVFVFWCSVVTLVAGLARVRRTSRPPLPSATA
jgi:hypothetical protein